MYSLSKRRIEFIRTGFAKLSRPPLNLFLVRYLDRCSRGIEHRLSIYDPCLMSRDMLPSLAPMLSGAQSCAECGSSRSTNLFLVDPVVLCGLPALDLLLVEPQRDLLLGRLDGVGAVADVAADILFVHASG